MKNDIKQKIVECKIHAFSKKGNGIGHVEREALPPLIVEVPFTAPGDVVRAKLLRRRGGVSLGKLEEIITPSPDRIAPRCVHFGTCGGCRFQHISYEKQLQVKEQGVASHYDKLKTVDTVFKPIFPSKQHWNYRNKMEFSFSSDAAGKKYLGLIMDSSRGKVLNLTECHLVNGWVVDALKTVHHWWNETELQAYNPPRDAGSLRTLTLREGMRTGDRMIVLTVSGNPDYAIQKRYLESFVAFLRDSIEPMAPGSTLSIFLRIQQIVKGMPTNFYEMLLHGPGYIREVLHINLDDGHPPTEFTFHISPTAFFQPNTYQAEQLYSLAFKLLQAAKEAVIYDLYCGTGTIGICMSKQAKKVLGIELFPESVLDARTNAKLNHCDNITILCGAVRHVLSHVEEHGVPLPDVVIVDPPRSGLDSEALTHLLLLRPKKIVYISCNPETQALNVKALLDQGYRLMTIQPVDEFPHTVHVENIVILERTE